MNKTKIEWVKNPDGTQGYTWNPITGCNNQRDGMCKGGNFPCYAYRLANGRLRDRCLANKNTATKNYDEDSYPFYPRFWEDRLEPIGLTGGNKRPHSYGYLGGFKEHKPKGIFVCDMSDLFGIGIPQGWTQRVMDTIKKCPNHRFYLLTKQPQNLVKFSPFPDNCWVGVTATDEPSLVNACQELHYIEAKIKYLSVEPLLNWFQDFITYGVHYWLKYGGINQVIIGSQTKPYKSPRIEWVEEIVRACDKAGIPVFVKNNLEKMCWEAGFNKIKDLSFWERIDHADDMVMAVDFRQEMPI